MSNVQELHDHTLIEQAISESVVTDPPAVQDFTQIDERVLAGVRFLDANVKNWWRKIRLDLFSLTCETRCVLGQIYGDYTEGEYVLGLETDAEAKMDSQRFGFYSYGNGPDWERLENDWVTVIRNRKQNDKSPDMSGAAT